MIIIGITALVAALIIIGTDVYLVIKGGFSATLSWWMYVNSTKYPIIPAAFGLILGVLFGHFFWNQDLDVIIGHGCIPVAK